MFRVNGLNSLCWYIKFKIAFIGTTYEFEQYSEQKKMQIQVSVIILNISSLFSIAPSYFWSNYLCYKPLNNSERKKKKNHSRPIIVMKTCTKNIFILEIIQSNNVNWLYNVCYPDMPQILHAAARIPFICVTIKLQLICVTVNQWEYRQDISEKEWLSWVNCGLTIEFLRCVFVCVFHQESQ